MIDTLPRPPRLTVAEVRSVMEHLQQQGIDPTLRRIRRALGNRGSFDTISSFRREVLGLADEAPASADVPPATVAARMSALAPEFWRTAVTEARAVVATELGAAQRDLGTLRERERELEGLLAESEERLEREALARAADRERVQTLGAAVEALAGRIETLTALHREQVQQLAATIAERDTALACARDQLGDLDRRLASATATIAAQEELIRQQGIERQQAQDGWAAERQRGAEQQAQAAAELADVRQELAAVSSERDVARALTAVSEGRLAATERGLAATQEQVQAQQRRAEQVASELVHQQQHAERLESERAGLLAELAAVRAASVVDRDAVQQLLMTVQTQADRHHQGLAEILARLPPAPLAG